MRRRGTRHRSPLTQPYRPVYRLCVADRRPTSAHRSGGTALQDRPRLRCPERFLAVFAVASLVAVATGCLVVAVDDASAGAWPLDLAAWSAGAVVALAVSRFASPTFARVVTLAAPIGLLASLAYPGQAGVHRWVDIGPFHANVAALLLPAFVVALAALVRDGSWIWLACAACAVLLVLQPDASQATAFAALAGPTRRPRGLPAHRGRSPAQPPARPAALALSAYFVFSALTPLFGT